MTVAPRYAEYGDAHDTGVSVPVMVPPGTRNLQAQPENGDFAPETPAEVAPSHGEAETATRALFEEEGPQSDDVHDGDTSWASQQYVMLGAAGAASPPMCSMTEAASEIGGEQAAACEQHAQYYLCRKADVDHIFVDHPMYCRTTDIYGSSNVNTYQEAGDFPDLDIRYSILCQAALAAPMLLWGRSEQPPALQDACLETPLLASRGSEQAAPLQPDGCSAAASAVMPKLCISNSTEALLPSLTPAAMALEVCQQQVLSAPPADRGRPSGSSGDVTARAGSCTVRPAEARPGPLLFIGNDWPCAPLALRLKHCVQQAAAAGSCQHVAGDAAFASRLTASLQHARSAFCIHNLAYQGTMPISAFPRLCLPDASLSALLWPPPGLRSTGSTPSGSDTDRAQSSERDAACSVAAAPEHAATSVNWMHVRARPSLFWKAHCNFVHFSMGTGSPREGRRHPCAWLQAALSEYDSICTVSPNYAREICSDEGMAFGMREVLCRRGVRWDFALLPYSPAVDMVSGCNQSLLLLSRLL